MDKKIGQVRLENYVIDVVHEEDRVTFFSVSDDPEPNKSRLLTWKRGAGFGARVVIRDSISDHEIVKPLSPEEFPLENVLRLIREHPEIWQGNVFTRLIGMEPEPLPCDLAAQLIAILETSGRRFDGVRP